MIRGTKRASMSFSAEEVEELNAALKGLVSGVSGRLNETLMGKLLLKVRRMRESLERSAPFPEGISPPDTTGEGADV